MYINFVTHRVLVLFSSTLYYTTYYFMCIILSLHIVQDVSSLVVLSDGRLASGSQDETVIIWNLTSGTCDQVLEGRTSVSEGECIGCI